MFGDGGVGDHSHPALVSRKEMFPFGFLNMPQIFLTAPRARQADTDCWSTGSPHASSPAPFLTVLFYFLFFLLPYFLFHGKLWREIGMGLVKLR